MELEKKIQEDWLVKTYKRVQIAAFSILLMRMLSFFEWRWDYLVEVSSMLLAWILIKYRKKQITQVHTGLSQPTPFASTLNPNDNLDKMIASVKIQGPPPSWFRVILVMTINFLSLNGIVWLILILIESMYGAENAKYMGYVMYPMFNLIFVGSLYVFFKLRFGKKPQP